MSLLDEALIRQGVVVELFENKRRPNEPIFFNAATSKIDTGHIIYRLRILDGMVATIVKREKTDTDTGNPIPITIEGRANEEAWVMIYAKIEHVLLTLLSLYARKADMKMKDRRHVRILEAFDDKLLPLHESLGIISQPSLGPSSIHIPPARQKINNLRIWRNWSKLQHSPAPPKMLNSDGKFFYYEWYTKTLKGLMDAFIICAQNSVLREMYNHFRNYM